MTDQPNFDQRITALVADLEREMAPFVNNTRAPRFVRVVVDQALETTHAAAAILRDYARQSA